MSALPSGEWAQHFVCKRNNLRMLVKYGLTLPWQPHRRTSTEAMQDSFQIGRDFCQGTSGILSLCTVRSTCPRELQYPPPSGLTSYSLCSVRVNIFSCKFKCPYFVEQCFPWQAQSSTALILGIFFLNKRIYTFYL